MGRGRRDKVHLTVEQRENLDAAQTHQMAERSGASDF